MVKALKPLILFAAGGILYSYIELAWRGYTHWTMLVLGGICFLLVGAINEVLPWEMPLVLQCLIGMYCILIPEFAAGLILNVRLNLHIWDYSALPFNVLGQICLYYAVVWYFLSAVGIVLDDLLRWKLFGEDKPKYKLI